MSKPVGDRRFTLRAMLLWTVHDFSALGLIAGQVVKGYTACPVCGGDTCSEYSRCLRKMVFLGSRKFLPEGHRFRRCRAAFNGHPELGEMPRRRTGPEIIEQAHERSNWLRNGGTENAEGHPVKVHGVK